MTIEALVSLLTKKLFVFKVNVIGLIEIRTLVSFLTEKFSFSRLR